MQDSSKKQTELQACNIWSHWLKLIFYKQTPSGEPGHKKEPLLIRQQSLREQQAPYPKDFLPPPIIIWLPVTREIPKQTVGRNLRRSCHERCDREPGPSQAIALFLNFLAQIHLNHLQLLPTKGDNSPGLDFSREWGMKMTWGWHQQPTHFVVSATHYPPSLLPRKASWDSAVCPGQPWTLTFARRPSAMPLPAHLLCLQSNKWWHSWKDFSVNPGRNYPRWWAWKAKVTVLSHFMRHNIVAWAHSTSYTCEAHLLL